jgi:site-specific DNA-methyltransferase (cytosine-N4-specific)
MNNIRCRIKDYIQPFERNLAFQELASVGMMKDPAGARQGTEFSVMTSLSAADVANRLAYWEMISSASDQIATVQSLREATVNVVRNGIDLVELKKRLPFSDEIPFPNRRCLRYGTHGIHEYRGKFFPQLVRSLINISGTEAGGVIADPMSGSGTAIVEGVLSGCVALGLDMNPLSTFLGNTKCQLLSASPSKLEAAYKKVRAAVLAPETRGRRKLAYFSNLPEPDQAYLKSWFAEEVLQGLDEIASLILAVAYEPAKNLMWVSLSNILRSVSWQKEDDLRVRKEVRLDVEIDPKKEFLEELARSIRAVLALLYQEGSPPTAAHSIVNGDARECATAWNDYRGKVDVMITSPPYATALPYLDTDRLSLCYLGLLPRPEHRNRDQMMIGNREVTERLRREYLVALEANGSLLPKNVRALIRKIEKLNDGTDVGFRRKNLPALLAKYFFDMRAVLAGMLDVLKPGGHAFIVVGNNHTIAGGKRVDINTAAFLADIAKLLGFEVSPSLPMDMLVSRDIFRSNAMATEEILYLKKPA